MTEKQFRYPGVKPFQSTDNQLFFGRSQDIEDLLDVVLLEKMVVLFGKSGYGKSSLLNAGLFPRLQAENISPLFIRIGSYVEGQSHSPLKSLTQWIDKAWANSKEADFLKEMAAGESLWLQIKQKQSALQNHFFLVFDQFEEFFTHPISEQIAFKKQLADLLYTELPQVLRDKTENLPQEQQRFLANTFEVKVLFSIRSDRMSGLDTMKSELPAILHKRYELKGLTKTQAKEAIEQPAALVNERFISPPFSYSPAALDLMLSKLAGTSQNIEAFQLQILCQYIEENTVLLKGIKHIEASNLPDMSNIYEVYYKRQIEKLPQEKRTLAHLVIEEGLLFEDIATGEARRLSVDAAVLMTNFGIDQSFLRNLENTFLLRREANSLGGFNYEISHDTLISPIQKFKAAHRAEQNRLENERKQQEVEAEAKAALAQVVKEKGLRSRAEKARKAAFIVTGLACFALLLALWQWNRSQNLLEKNYKVTHDYVMVKLNTFTEDSIFILRFENLIQAANADRNIPLGHKYSSQQQVKNKYAELIAWFVVCGQGNQSKREKEHLQRAYHFLQLAYQFTQQQMPPIGTDTLAYLEKQYPIFADTETLKGLRKRIYYPKMLSIKGGTFQMGNCMVSEKANEPDELPIHTVQIDDFELGETEVTVWQYFLFCEITGYEKPPLSRLGWHGDAPVVKVTWYDAMQYCQWLSEKEKLSPAFQYEEAKDGKSARDTTSYQGNFDPITHKWQGEGYRLPTEAEWEYAARLTSSGVSYDFEYAGCNTANAKEYVYFDQYNKGQPTFVKQLKPNGIGLFDMSGNVYEWCIDNYDEHFYEKANKATNKLNLWNDKTAKENRTIRGGSWFGALPKCRVSNRLAFTANNGTDNFGFRVCRKK
ncbi:MAG: SUMF1/EgtB/PvdO family nonheme iron enzyme [Bacteroidia bacterium]